MILDIFTKHCKKSQAMEHEIRLPRSGLVLVTGPSQSGKTKAATEILMGGARTFVDKPCRLLIISKHSNQASYLELAQHIPSVSFYQINDEISEKTFLKEFNLQPSDKGSRVVLLDDVTL